VSSLRPYKPLLEALYARYHQPLYRSLDPVEIVWGYTHPEDQAIAGLWAALFAWGRRSVAIQKTHALLQSLAPSPYAYLRTGQVLRISLRHRTWKPETITRLWEKLQELYGRCGSLAGFFRPYRESLWEGVAAFQAEMTKGAPELRRHLGDLRAGSASKRLWLWLRWMIRKDAIDPGPWAGTFFRCPAPHSARCAPTGMGPPNWDCRRFRAELASGGPAHRSLSGDNAQ